MVAAAVVAAAALARAAGWVTGPPISPPGQIALIPSIALTPSGDQIVAWEHVATDGTPQAIVVRTARPGQGLGPAQLLPVPDAFDLSPTVGADGTAALVWLESSSPNNDDVHIARRAPGERAFTQATPFPLGGSANGSPAVAVTDGAVYVAQATQGRQGHDRHDGDPCRPPARRGLEPGGAGWRASRHCELHLGRTHLDGGR
jgi:hypothetical protein